MVLKRVKLGLPSAPRAEPGVPPLCPQRSPAPSATAAPKPGPPQEVSGGRSGGTGGVGGCPPLTPPVFVSPPGAAAAPSAARVPRARVLRGGGRRLVPPRRHVSAPPAPPQPLGGSPGLTNSPVLCFSLRSRSGSFPFAETPLFGQNSGGYFEGAGGAAVQPSPPPPPPPPASSQAPPASAPVPMYVAGGQILGSPPAPPQGSTGTPGTPGGGTYVIQGGYMGGGGAAYAHTTRASPATVRARHGGGATWIWGVGGSGRGGDMTLLGMGGFA